MPHTALLATGPYKSPYAFSSHPMLGYCPRTGPLKFGANNLSEDTTRLLMTALSFVYTL